MIKETIEKNTEVKVNSKEIAILKKYFPSCFDKNDKFDIKVFEDLIRTEDVDIKKEGYSLNFLGKSYARYLANLDSETVIVPDKGNKDTNSQNIYIVGDNLDALQHLKYSYSGKIKCIYIDPPYNTGSDGFVYNDKFEFTAEELSKKIGIEESEAERVLNMQGKSTHSAWLTFMYPRLELAKDLLDEDGVIFISIDDNEQSNLSLICSDIFGEHNFISQLTWEKKKKGSYLSNNITNIKEYIFVYAKNKPLFTGLIGEINREEETYPCVNANNSRDIRIIPAGIDSKYREKDFTMKKGEIISDTTMNLVLHSDLVIKDGVLANDLIIEGNWRYGQDAMTEYAQKHELYITRDLYLRRIVSEPRYKGLKDLLLRSGETQESGYSYDFSFEDLQSGGWGSNEDADEEQRLLFGEQSLMSYPKPVLLIMKLLATLQKDNFTVCDFFSGSATTAEAVMRLNAKGKKIKYIVVQLPEIFEEKSKAYKAGFKNIDEIGRERIRRAAKKISQENPEKAKDVDLGFKTYYLQATNKQTLDKIMNFDPSFPLDAQDIKSQFGNETILETWKIKDGYGFNVDVEEIDLVGYTAYMLSSENNGTGLYLLDEMPENAIVELVRKIEAYELNIDRIIEYGYAFSYSTNLSLRSNLKTLKNRPPIEPIIRY